MRGTFPLLTLMGVLLLALALAPSTEENAALLREDPLQTNRRLLEGWRKDSAHLARLQEDLHNFWQLPVEQRARLRQLDEELHQQDSATQKRLWSTLERYHAWLNRLPAEERRKIESTSDWSARLEIVKSLRVEEWLRRQPLPEQNRVRGLPEKERVLEIARLQENQRQRVAQVNQMLRRPNVREWPAKLTDFPPEVQTFVEKQLDKQLTQRERNFLRRAEKKPWPSYARNLHELWRKYQRHFPGDKPPGPPELWERVRTSLPEVPDGVLFHFMMTQLTEEERQGIQYARSDPAALERLKQEYFQRNPMELRKLQKLDRRAPMTSPMDRVD